MSTDLLWNIDVWLVEFENEVDAHFSAGNAEHGRTAFKDWHYKVSSSLAAAKPDVSLQFERTDKITRQGISPATRSQFMRSCGIPAKSCLLRLKKDLTKRSRSNES
jgi:hypothetical protein